MRVYHFNISSSSEIRQKFKKDFYLIFVLPRSVVSHTVLCWRLSVCSEQGNFVSYRCIIRFVWLSNEDAEVDQNVFDFYTCACIACSMRSLLWCASSRIHCAQSGFCVIIVRHLWQLRSFQEYAYSFCPIVCRLIADSTLQLYCFTIKYPFSLFSLPLFLFSPVCCCSVL